MPEEFLEGTKKDALHRLNIELNKLLTCCPNVETREYFQKQFDTYRNLFFEFLNDQKNAIDWSKIEQLPDRLVLNYSDLDEISDYETIRAMLNQLVVVKLNGGLGTSMGCSGPKSIINVRNHLTFLDLTVQQIEVSYHHFLTHFFLNFQLSFTSTDNSN